MTFRFSRALLQFARRPTQTAFPFATLRAIFFKTFTSHTRIGIPRPQCPKLLPVVLSQDKALQSSGSFHPESSASGTSTPTSEIDSTSTSTEENKKQDKKKGKTTATQDRWTEDQVKYLVNLWEANISRLESQQSRKQSKICQT